MITFNLFYLKLINVIIIIIGIKLKKPTMIIKIKIIKIKLIIIIKRKKKYEKHGGIPFSKIKKILKVNIKFNKIFYIKN